ncbi:histidinol-phosphatase HisJ family protein [Deinococcus peraridilitoris]|nr:histidinol-phosphatase HisJ family protein [Deinococcus peraridilitoris]
MHTPLCQHATGTPLEMARAALDAGLAGITFTDHMPMPAWYDAPWRMRRDQLDHYVSSVREAQSAFASRLEVRLGLEADFHPGTEHWIEEVLSAHEWDYVIGSVHYIGAWGFDNPEFQDEYERRDPGALYRSYYALIEGAARSGLFDAIGHLDLPKKFGLRAPEDGPALAALDVIAARGLALDFNTAGWRKVVGEAYPSPELTYQAVARGIPFVLGSDAHSPEEVGYRLGDARQLLLEEGARVVTFKARILQEEDSEAQRG